MSKLVLHGALRALLTTTLALAALSARAAGLPTGLGWHALPNTNLKSVCTGTAGNCDNITAAWNGGLFDTSRNRLIVWGGGHADYYGNEFYALDVSNQTIKRLNEPSTGTPTVCGNSGVMPDGTPTSRHSYNHIAYIAHADKMYLFGGAGSPCGWILSDTWTFDFANLTWKKMGATGGPPQDYGYVTVYDPVTKKVYIAGTMKMWSYSLENDSYQELFSTGTETNRYSSATLDTKRHLMVAVGDGDVWVFDLSSGSNYQRQIWTTTGANSIVQQAYPGVAYDPVTDRVVAWDGGDTVYSLNLDTKVWTSQTYSGGPGAAMSNGTFGRFRYSQADNAFVVVNSVNQASYALRINADAGTPVPPVTPPPTDPTPPPTTTPPSSGSDFAARCAAAGVLKCNGFESSSDLGDGIYPASDNVIRATIDTSTKASGNGSLKFTIPASGGQNAAGSWHTGFGQAFGQNSTFYVQFRQRLSPEMLTPSNGGGGFKQVIFHHGTSTCANVEITTGNLFWRGWPAMYSRCGNDGFEKTLSNGDILLQSGADYQCHYQDPTSRTPPCGYYHTNEWMTFYYKVSIGTWGQANSTVQAWLAYEGQPLGQFMNETNLTLINDGPGTESYDTMTLLPYDTGRNSAASNSAVWYDDLIISTQPIAAPSGTAQVLPSPPTNVKVQ